uniref:RING-type domain-containing protein n=1 Tax=Caenorhabditis tropicalis TaxID=1561998 RepID=A0A1I7UV60_9PELO
MSNISDLPAHLMFCCPVCRDTYDTDERCPLSIPCGHTVCKECAARLPELFDEFTFAIVKINCPVCRAKHVVQRFADTPHGFPVNAQLLLIIDRMMEVADREKNAKPRRVEVNCRDCQKKVTVDSCVKCECFAEEEGGPEQDLLIMLTTFGYSQPLLGYMVLKTTVDGGT